VLPPDGDICSSKIWNYVNTLIHLHRHMKEARQDILDAIKIYYKELGFRRDNSRVTHQAQARTALSNVMREYGMTYEEIGVYVNRDHSTVVHDCSHQDDELRTWSGYKSAYEKCKAIVGSALVGDLDDIIAYLKEKQDALQVQIDEYLKKKQENDARIKELAADGVEIG